MFGQNNQQQSTGGIFGAAPQLGQSTGGFSFGAGSSGGATSSAPSTGGFTFSAPASTGFSFGSATSASTGTPGNTGGFNLGGLTPAGQASGFNFGSTTSGGFSFATPASTSAPASTLQNKGFAFGSSSSTLPSSGLSFGTPSTQQISSGFNAGSTGASGFTFSGQPSTTTPATSSMTLGGTAASVAASPLTLGKPAASTGPTTSGFTLGGATALPTGLFGSRPGGLSDPTPSQGLSFGGAKTTAPTIGASMPAFSFAGGSTAPPSLASTGLSLTSNTLGSAVPSSGLTLGSGQKTTTVGGLTLGGKFPSTFSTASTSSANTGLNFASFKPVSTTATPLLTSLSGSAKTTAAPTTSATSEGLTFVSGKLPTASTAAVSTAAGLPGTAGFQFGTGTTRTTTSTTSLSTAPTTTTTTSAGVGTITITSSAPSSSTTSSATSSVPQLTYKQLEELINKWTLDLTEYEKTFLDQAAEVNAWDRLLMENGEKITELNAGVENVKAEQDRLDQELDFIMAQQKELEEMLKPLEDAVKDGNTGGRQLQQADKERDVTYKLANDIDGQLKQMVQDLKSIIDHLNTSNTQKQDNEDPILQIAKILNAHMNSLQWIDQNSGILQRKVDEISRLSETRRKEQERNFRLAFD